MTQPARPGISARIKSRTLISADKFEQLWSKVDKAFHEIHAKNASSLSFEEIYRSVYNIVLLKQGSRLYDNIKQSLSAFMEKRAEIIMSCDTDLDFLNAMQSQWEDTRLCLMMIRDILLYMDRTFVKATDLKSSFDLGLTLFLDIVFHSKSFPIRDRFLSSILSQILRERNGEIVDQFQLKSLINMLVTLGGGDIIANGENQKRKLASSPYTDDFETDFLLQTVEFYKSVSHVFLQSNDVPSYVKMVLRRIDQEEDRCSHYIHPSTRKQLIETVDNELITIHLDKLINTGNGNLMSQLRDDRIEDIGFLFQAVIKVPDGLGNFNDAVANFIKSTGTKFSAQHIEGKENSNNTKINKSPAVSWVEDVINLFQRMDKILKQSMANNSLCEAKINDAFSSFINSNKKSAFYLASYLDENLSKKAKKSSPELESIVKNAILILKFITDKDIFEHSYKNNLAKRILFDKCLSEDEEKNVISLFKAECGNQFTSRMEGMFHDIRLSSELSSDFKDFTKDRDTGFTCSMNTLVLTSSFWPVQSSTSTPLLPSSLEAMITCFTTFYTGKYNGRRLSWAWNLGSVDMTYHISLGKRKEINMTTYCALIMLLFNEDKVLKYYEIVEKSGIDENELIRCLLSLSCGKIKLLIKSPKSKTVDRNDEFTLNNDFDIPQYRFKLPMIIMNKKTSDEKDDDLQEKVDEERRDVVDASIVRVMKSRRTIAHNELISQVTQQLSSRFMPNPILIKRRIEVLIEREYMIRDSTDRKWYNYCA